MALAHGDYENGILPVDLTHDEAVYLEELLCALAEKEVEEAASIKNKIADRLYSYAHWKNNHHAHMGKSA